MWVFFSHTAGSTDRRNTPPHDNTERDTGRWRWVNDDGPRGFRLFFSPQGDGLIAICLARKDRARCWTSSERAKTDPQWWTQQQQHWTGNALTELGSAVCVVLCENGSTDWLQRACALALHLFQHGTIAASVSLPPLSHLLASFPFLTCYAVHCHANPFCDSLPSRIHHRSPNTRHTDFPPYESLDGALA